jgi:hypothetical protein
MAEKPKPAKAVKKTNVPKKSQPTNVRDRMNEADQQLRSEGR